MDKYRTIIEALERCKTLVEFEIYDDSTDLQELVETLSTCGFDLYGMLESDCEYEDVFNEVENILEGLK